MTLRLTNKKTNNLVYEHSISAYQPVPWFSPLFTHDIHDVLLLLAERKQEIMCSDSLNKPTYVLNLAVNKLDLIKVSSVLRALSHPSVVEIEYVSRSSGHSTRQIVPHTLIQMGAFTYIRAFDRLKNEFRTFKLNRIIQSTQLIHQVASFENKNCDKEWQYEIGVIIIPNGVEHQETIAIDYQLTAGELIVKLKNLYSCIF